SRRAFLLDLDGDGPDKAEELATDGTEHLRAGLAPRRECQVATVQTVLCLQCDLVRRRAEAALPSLQLLAQSRSMATSPCGFEAPRTDVSVAGLGDRTLPTSVAAGVFARHDAAVGHELLGSLEAREAADLDGEGGCTELPDTTQGLEAVDHGTHRR